MKIVLINALANKEFLLYSEVFQLELVNLGYLSAVLLRDGHEVEIIDQMLHRMADAEVVDRVERFRPEVVGLTITTANISKSLELSTAIKARTGATIVCGGYYPTPFPEIVKHDEIDLAVLGEGENTLREIVDRLGRGEDLRGIAGTAWLDEGAVREGPKRERISDLDSLPFPDRRFSRPDMMRVGFLSSNQAKDRSLPVVTSRGCNMSCGFCASPVMWHGVWHGRSPENVIEEIRELRNKLRVNFLFFQDEELNTDRDRAMTIYRRMREEKFGMKWTTQTSIHFMDIELADAMIDCGLNTLYLGYESGAREILDKMPKRYSLDKALMLNEHLQKRGVFTTGNFMLGFPWESRETLKQTFAFVRKLNLDISIVIYYRPQPKTTFADLVTREGFFDPATFQETNHNPFAPPMPTYHLTSKEVERAAMTFMVSTYLRPTYWFRVLYRIIRQPVRLRAYWGFASVVLSSTIRALTWKYLRRSPADSAAK
ncbi:MAG: radical SAM protein [Candidatus Lernaella stagnicola]|nr:radical SAM protein [Candidatus Lernaella stagnicola]